MNEKPNIFRIEKLIYFFVWILAVIYSIYCFGNTSYKYFQNYKDHYSDFTTGLRFISKKRDKADFEWETIFYLLRNFYPWILVYIFISEIIRSLHLSIKVLQLWQTCFTILYIGIRIGGISLFIILFQPIIFYFTLITFKNSISVWLCNGSSLFLIMYYKKVNTTEAFHEYSNLNEYELYVTTLSLCWLNLKCTSYCLEKPHARGFLEMLSYCLYPPTFFTGPFILYKNFCGIYRPMDYAPIRERMTKCLLNFTRALLWFLFGIFCLHYIYVTATSFQPKLVKTFSSWSLYGFGYTMGQHFHIKYVVIYGLSTSVASYENINVPHLPRCIGRIHLYSDMWKYFDPGLYTFLVSHIYVPVMEVAPYKPFATLLCFLFVYLWHGIENYILIWSLLNYFGVSLEYFCESLNKKYLENEKNKKLLDPYWVRRIKCLLSAPLLVMSALSNFYFFAGIEIGNIFYRRIFLDNIFNTALLLLVLYCCCQVSVELRSVNAKKM